MNNIPLIDLYRQYRSVKKEIDSAITKTIKNSAFINGEDNRLFEKEFSEYLGLKYAIGVGSGSVALDLSLEALNIGEGDEVILPSLTFIATAEAVSHRGAVPVFVDIEEQTLNIDPHKIEEKISKKTKAIIAVHLYGNPCNMDQILKLANTYKLKVIEDCAQAHGAIYKNKKVGNFSDAAIYSFFPGKNLGCFGDGGAVVTNNKDVAEKVRLLKDHGRIDKYEHKILGYGARLDNLQAAILRVKLMHLDNWNKKRREIAATYSNKIEGDFVLPSVTRDSVAVYYVYTLRHPRRELIMKKLKENGISVGIYYPIPLHLQGAYKFLNNRKGSLPLTEKACNEIFSIPMFPELNGSEIRKIVNCLNRSQ
ncbi:MAG: hypothetical protein ACD_31C00005G0039 [uncultured bacterium]|uniref:Erythromycin biosynthesis sensory transduction protein eryC1 n=3 Tax=Candidatus Daviesiibacteriota TaxID=1752718 RepID=A0A0G0HEV2_9BACT|nr:MAG: hypothetical protein ACD_31C00005G0039 [uncultured bacterium]KKQ10614.1 MAG: erythromycin biosynthesis sensory transduction protein eryC1 [Candidatus Daviesbacteria bacterium GW2011_GWB1_36_5]KKQ15745.1 MAG: erythromycin biosynthesis sensory transduction protein eryC1 [Candidatus Daviesbacteria bacterium GW2011_GWA1_36_8]OGE17838.1 MAG: hypothetical protein A2858_03785 [Candidatus Daviesbacteria bacterium RIFCSPHIGHO2_01_FULL_36_37]